MFNTEVKEYDVVFVFKEERMKTKLVNHKNTTSMSITYS